MMYLCNINRVTTSLLKLRSLKMTVVLPLGQQFSIVTLFASLFTYRVHVYSMYGWRCTELVISVKPTMVCVANKHYCPIPRYLKRFENVVSFNCFVWRNGELLSECALQRCCFRCRGRRGRVDRLLSYGIKRSAVVLRDQRLSASTRFVRAICLRITRTLVTKINKKTPETLVSV